MKSNKGFTLVELLIAIAILSIVLTTVTSVIMTGSKQFKKGSADADVQRQAQLVVNQIEDMVIDTNGGVYYADYTDTKEFVLYNAVSINGTVTYTKELIKWSAIDATLSYSKWNVDYDSDANTYTVAGAAVYADQLMAEDITDFKIDLSDTRKDTDKDGNETEIVQSVQITVGCSGSGGLVSYATSPIITLRNRMMLSNSPELIFPNTPVMEENLAIYIAGSETATPVKINYPATEVERGKTYKLYLMVNDSYAIANNLIDWKITDAGITSSVSSDGTLIVGATEAGNSLSVKASYKDNADKNATATVKVANGKEINGVRIIPIGSSQTTVTDAHGNQITQYDPFKPQFDSAVILDGFSETDKSTLEYSWRITKADDNNVDFAGASIQENGKSKLKLNINCDTSLENKRIRIHLLVTAPDLGITDESNGGKSTYYDFTIPRVGDTMDSYIARGKENIEYNYDPHDMYSVDDPPYTVYFCDMYGNHLPELDYLVDEAVDITSAWAGGVNLLIKDVLPPERDYYLKYIGHCIDNEGNTYNYERIFFIPAVQIIGQNTTTTWIGFGDSHVGIDYKLYGYSGYESGAGKGWSGKYTVEVQEIISNAPAGVEITATVSDSAVMDAENNLMSSSVIFDLSGNLNGVDSSDIKVHSIRVKIQMTGTEIFAYSTLTFTE